MSRAPAEVSNRRACVVPRAPTWAHRESRRDGVRPGTGQRHPPTGPLVPSVTKCLARSGTSGSARRAIPWRRWESPRGFQRTALSVNRFDRKCRSLEMSGRAFASSRRPSPNTTGGSIPNSGRSTRPRHASPAEPGVLVGRESEPPSSSARALRTGSPAGGPPGTDLGAAPDSPLGRTEPGDSVGRKRRIGNASNGYIPCRTWSRGRQ